jgi:hypothetical protein
MDRGPVALGEDTGPRDCLANWKGDLAVLRVAAQEFGVKAFNAYQERFFQALEKHGTNARYIAAFRPGAGKTILAAAWAATVRGDGNYPIVFVAPFRALCRQVATVFARFDHDFGKSYCFIGDEDSSVVPQFKAALQSGKCVIVCTPELAVTGLAGHTGTVLPILDEVHLVYDPSRGWLYDLMLRKFKGKPLLAMSGTLGKKSVSVLKAYPNAKVPCITVGGGATATMPPVKASKYKGRAPSTSSVAGLLEKLVEGHGQALCFVASKAYGYSLLGEYRSRFPRRSSEFHCADLATDVREDIEYGFSSGKIQCLIHTQTLVTGVDFDVTAGVVAQVRTGMGDVPIYDVIQAASRVGRRRPGVVHLLLPEGYDHLEYRQKIAELDFGPVPMMATVDYWTASLWRAHADQLGVRMVPDHPPSLDIVNQARERLGAQYYAAIAMGLCPATVMEMRSAAYRIESQLPEDAPDDLIAVKVAEALHHVGEIANEIHYPTQRIPTVLSRHSKWGDPGGPWRAQIAEAIYREGMRHGKATTKTPKFVFNGIRYVVQRTLPLLSAYDQATDVLKRSFRLEG